MEKERPKPISLIKADPQNPTKLWLNKQALKLIAQTPGPISILSICGQQKSGKSFLLNTLFFSGKGFQVSSTTQQCTKGLMLWSQPISGKGNKGNIWVIDTQGFGSTSEDSDYDGKIFLLSTLLSSTLMYNSFGAIDQNALQKFILMCQTAKIIDSSLNQIQLYWILRDFSLAMQNKQGCPLTPDQYLQNSLQTTKTEGVISKIFSQRHCVPLIRPTISQQKLNKLQNTDLKELRPEFVDQIYKLRKKLINNIWPKTLNKHQLTGQSFSFLIQNIVDQINKGRVQCNLNTSWSHISSFQCQKVFDKILKDVKDKIQHIKRVLPLNKEEISKVQKQCINSNIELYRKKSKGFFLNAQISQEKLKIRINQLISQLQKQNNSYLKNQIKSIVNHQMNQAVTKLKNILSLSNFPNKYFEQFYFIKECIKNKFSTFKEWEVIYYEAVMQASLIILEDFAEKIKKNQLDRNQKYQDLKQNYKKLQKQLKELKNSEAEQRKFSQTLIQQAKLQKQQMINELNKSKTQIQSLYKKLLKQSEIEIKKLQQLLKDKEHLLGQLKHKSQMSQIIHNENLKLLKSKNEMQEVLLRDQQQQIKSTANTFQQLQKQYENKIKLSNQQKNRQISEINSAFNQLQQKFYEEKSRYNQLSQHNKSQQQQLLNELAHKNQQIFDLRRQVALQQQSLTSNFQSILKDQRIKNQQKVNQLYDLCQTYQRKIQLYEMKLEEQIIKNEKLETFDQKNLQLQQYIKSLNSQIEQLNQDLQRKNQQIQSQKKSHQKFYNHMKQNFQLQVQTLQQELIKMRKNKQGEIDQFKQQNQQLCEQIKSLQKQWIQKLNKKTKQLEEFYQSQNQQNQIAHEKQLSLLKNQIDSYINQLQETSNQKRTLIIQKEELVQIISQIKNKASVPCPECSLKNNQIFKLKNQIDDNQRQFSVYQNSISKLKSQNQNILKELKEVQKNKNDLTLKFAQTTQKCNTQINQIKKQFELLREENNKLFDQLNIAKNKIQTQQREKINKNNEIALKAEIAIKKEQMYKQNMNIYKQTIQKLRNQNTDLRAKFQAKFINQSKNKIEKKSKEENGNTPQQINFQQNFIYSKLNQLKINTPQDFDSLKIQYENRIQQLQQQNQKLRKMIEQQQKFNEQKRKSSKLSNLLESDQKGFQLEEIRKQNKQLRKQIQAYLQRQIDSMQSKKIVRNSSAQNLSRNIDIDQSRIKSLREQIQNMNRKYQLRIKQYDQKIDQLEHQKYLLKQEVIMMKSQLDRRGHYNQKILEEQIQMLKKQKISYEQMTNKKINSLQQSISSKTQEADRKLSQAENKYKKLRNDYEKEVNKLQIENQKHKSKYQNLLKVNNQLITQIQSLRKRPNPQLKGNQFTKFDLNIPTNGTENQVTPNSQLKQKYSKKIAELFK